MLYQVIVKQYDPWLSYACFNWFSVFNIGWWVVDAYLEINAYVNMLIVPVVVYKMKLLIK